MLHNFCCSLLIRIVLRQNMIGQLLMEQIGIGDAKVRYVVTAIAVVIVVGVAARVAARVAADARTAACGAARVAAGVATTRPRLSTTCERKREREKGK